MGNKLGPLIREARTNAGYTQEQLAKKIKVITASEISKTERGEFEPTQAVLKEIARATGVTQTSLIEAAKDSTYKNTKTSSGSSSSTGKTSDTSKKKRKSSSEKSDSTGSGTMKLSETEKKLVSAYRKADAASKKTALHILRGEKVEITELIPFMIDGFIGNGENSSGSGNNEGLGGLGSLIDIIGKIK